MVSEQSRWRFRRMLPSEINQNPVQGEFFTATADLPERLVRESLQNSLDARSGAGPVRVRFTFSGEERALPVDIAARYLLDLSPHIQADSDASTAERDAIEKAQACLSGPMTWMTVEDFGTTGLQGNIQANDPKEPGNHFWGFFRSVGISPKGEDSGGSWGLGKWVFPDASTINAYLGATQRSDEDRILLMGMAVLRTHTVGGAKHPPYGQFAAATDALDDEWLPLPIDSDADPDFVLGALTDFGLDRLGYPGLSVVVPYPKEGLTPAAIARAVITQYFLPIVRGDLTVEIDAPDERERVIDADTIAREVSGIPMTDGENAHDEESPESLAGVIRLAQWAIRQSDDAHIPLRVPTVSNDTIDQLELDDLRQRYEQRDRLAFWLETRVQRRGSQERIPSRFRLYLERADGLATGHDYFVRGHLSIPKMDHIRRYEARALVVVDGESELGHLLRDAEGPAHISWDPHEQRLKDHWVGGYLRVQEVRRAAVQLLQRLAERPDEQQFDALADLFPADPAEIRGRTPSGRRGGYSPLPDPPPPPLPSLSLSRSGAGFSVHAPAGSNIVGSEWSLRFAYDVARGNPFSQFEQGVRQGIPDFSVGDDGVEVKGAFAEVVRVADNELHFRVLSDDFHLTVIGLDDRDVIVDVQRIEDSKKFVDTGPAT